MELFQLNTPTSDFTETILARENHRRELQGGARFKSMSAKRLSLTLPEIALIAMTRGALGVGIGLLLSDGLEKDERRSAGLALLAVGVMTTIPILLRLRNELK